MRLLLAATVWVGCGGGDDGGDNRDLTNHAAAAFVAALGCVF